MRKTRSTIVWIWICLCLLPDAARLGAASEPLVLPVEDDFLKGSIVHKGGGPTGSLIYEGLVTQNSRGGYDGWLAESWHGDDQARVWTFELVRGACWHDGTPFTAADVKFTHDYMKEKNLWLAAVLWMVDRVECPDDHTAVFHLKESFPEFLDHLSHCPGVVVIPRHIWAGIEDPMRHEDRTLVGTGPFAFVRRVPGQYCELRAFEGYHGAKPSFDRVILRVMQNADIRHLALKSGQIDAMDGVLPWTAPLLERERNIALIRHPGQRLYGLCFNCRGGPTASPAFRRALAHAVDRERIVRLVFQGHARPATTWLMPRHAAAFIDETIGACDYDLDRARQLLAEAGYRMDKDILRDPEGAPVRLVFVLGGKAATCVAQKMAEVMKEDFSRLGIGLELKQVDFSMWSKEIHENHLFMSGMPDLMHDGPDDLTHFQSHSFFGRPNWYGYASEAFDRLADELQRTRATDRRRDLALAMQRILAADVPAVAVCEADGLIAYRSDRIAFPVPAETMYGSLVDLQTLLAVTPAGTR